MEHGYHSIWSLLSFDETNQPHECQIRCQLHLRSLPHLIRNDYSGPLRRVPPPVGVHCRQNRRRSAHQHFMLVSDAPFLLLELESINNSQKQQTWLVIPNLGQSLFIFAMQNSVCDDFHLFKLFASRWCSFFSIFLLIVKKISFFSINTQKCR